MKEIDWAEGWEPCPFCGSKSLEFSSNLGKPFIYCQCCGAQSGEGFSDQEAKDMWNLRDTRNEND